MPVSLIRLACIVLVLALLSACTREPGESEAQALLRHVPADTPYAFVTSRLMPESIRGRLGDYYAAQLAAQRPAISRVRQQVMASADSAEVTRELGEFFAVLDAAFAEFEGRDTAAALRELGIEPVTRSVLYGIGVLPALRVEIADGAKVDAMLDRIERRAGLAADRGTLGAQAYRRIDLGAADLVIAVNDGELVAGVLADTLFDRDLAMLLGQSAPARSLADSGEIAELIARHGFAGYGEGFVKLDELVGLLVGEGAGLNEDVMRALAGPRQPLTPGCVRMTRGLVDGMPRMVMGVTAADDDQIAVRGIWEAQPAVAAYLRKLAAPVPGVGMPDEGLVSFGLGLELPQLRNAIEALLRTIAKQGSDCEWVDADALRAVTPQLNLVLGPMTAGIKGFNLRIDDLRIDPDTLEPSAISAGLLAAVDDPRGVFALGAMFSPALASLDIPQDGSFVPLPVDPDLGANLPPMQVAMLDRALLLVAGGAADDLGTRLRDAATVTPPPLMAADYAVQQLVEGLGPAMEGAARQLHDQGDIDAAAEIREQLAGFRLQADLFERSRVLLYATDAGLVMDQVMEFR